MIINQEKNYGREYHRGDIYYISRDPGYNYVPGTSYSIDPKQGRPAIIISNDEVNQLSHKVLVVYCTRDTSKVTKQDLKVYGNFILSSTKCAGSKVIGVEIASVHKDLIGDYIGTVYNCDDDYYNLNEALTCVLGLFEPTYGGVSEIGETSEAVATAESEIPNNAEFLQLVHERDFYKRMYEDIIERLTLK